MIVTVNRLKVHYYIAFYLVMALVFLSSCGQKDFASCATAEEMAAFSARRFGRMYDRAFVSRFTYTKTVEANDTYCGFWGYKGYLFFRHFNQRRVNKFKDKAVFQEWLPMSVLRSYSWDTERSDTLPTLSARAPTGVSPSESLMTSWQDMGNIPSCIIEYQRALEIYSPLNKRCINNFRYEIFGQDDTAVRIGFTSIPGLTPKKSRIFGSGELVIEKATGNVLSVTMEDYLDLWSVHPHAKTVDWTLVTRHKISVGYKEKGGKIYPSSIDLDVRWNKDGDGQIYSIAINSRKKPFKNKLHEHYHLEYEADRPIEKDNGLPKKISESSFHGFWGPFDYAAWVNDSTLYWLDKDKVEKDLYIKDFTLQLQAMDYSYKNVNTGAAINDSDIKALDEITKTISRLFEK